MPLNITKRSDYYFSDAEGNTHQFSRKQAGELLSDIDEAERQIADYFGNADFNYQIVEGIISPVAITRKSRELDAISIRQFGGGFSLFSYKVAPNGYLHDEQVHNVAPALYYAWIFRLAACGAPTFYTVSYVGTAKFLAAVYQNCQKPEGSHSTLQRVIKPKIVIKNPDPQGYIRVLMGLGAGLGEHKATQLLDVFNTPFSVFMAEVNEITSVEGFGKRSAEKIFKSIGKEA